MSLLSDNEIHEAIKSAKQVNHNYAGWVADQRIEWGKAVQAAILAKLAAKELPEPAYVVDACVLDRAKKCCRAIHCTRRQDVFTAAQLHEAHAQGFAAGAAAQLAEKPSAYELSATKYANGRELVYTVPDALASYIKVEPLYTRREAK